MTINLIFDDMAKSYVCVNIFGQNVQFQGTGVNFLSKQMRYFGDLTVDSFSQNGHVVILKDRQNNMFASVNGNIPFRMTVVMERQGDMPLLERLDKLSITVTSIPKVKMLFVTDEMAKRLNESWGQEFAQTIEQHRNYSLKDMEKISDEEKLEMKRLCCSTRVALNRDIAQRKADRENAREARTILNDKMELLEMRESQQSVLSFPFSPIIQKSYVQSQTNVVYGSDEASFKYIDFFGAEPCRINVSELMCNHLIDQDDQPKVRPLVPKCESQSQKPTEIGEKIVSRK